MLISTIQIFEKTRNQLQDEVFPLTKILFFDKINNKIIFQYLLVEQNKSFKLKCKTKEYKYDNFSVSFFSSKLLKQLIF